MAESKVSDKIWIMGTGREALMLYSQLLLEKAILFSFNMLQNAAATFNWKPLQAFCFIWFLCVKGSCKNENNRNQQDQEK